MMVVDADKQNARRHDCQEPRLQPDDIIVSIGGTPIAGMNFAQACCLFSTKSEMTTTTTSTSDEPGEEMIHAKLVVAR